jgi:hypothetical protein
MERTRDLKINPKITESLNSTIIPDTRQDRLLPGFPIRHEPTSNESSRQPYLQWRDRFHPVPIRSHLADGSLKTVPFRTGTPLDFSKLVGNALREAFDPLGGSEAAPSGTSAGLDARHDGLGAPCSPGDSSFCFDFAIKREHLCG